MTLLKLIDASLSRAMPTLWPLVRRNCIPIAILAALLLRMLRHKHTATPDTCMCGEHIDLHPTDHGPCVFAFHGLPRSIKPHR